jgi:hypothetical protein
MSAEEQTYTYTLTYESGKVRSRSNVTRGNLHYNVFPQPKWEGKRPIHVNVQPAVDAVMLKRLMMQLHPLKGYGVQNGSSFHLRGVIV